MYSLEYINCRVCGSDIPRFLGIRGNREYMGWEDHNNSEEHIVTNVVKCKRCGFVYTNPLIITKTKKYDDPSDYFSSSSAKPEMLFGAVLDLIERYAKRGRILDVGCGKGEFLSVAKERGWEPYGVEPSAAFANFASEKYSIDINGGYLKEARYPDSFFDAVTLNMALEHIDHPREIIFEIKRILKKDGFLFIEVPNMDSLMLKIAALYFRVNGKGWSPLLSPLHYPYHSYGYNRSSIRCLLSTQDFYIEKAAVRDSSLRGFREDAGGLGFEKNMRNIVAKAAGLLGQGDVLMVVAKRKS